MYSRIVEICTVKKHEMPRNERGEEIIPSEDSKWITLQWFDSADYDTQENLNDAAENFAQQIINNTNFGVFIRIQKSKEVRKFGLLDGFEFETEILYCKEVGYAPEGYAPESQQQENK